MSFVQVFGGWDEWDEMFLVREDCCIDYCTLLWVDVLTIIASLNYQAPCGCA